MSILFELVFRYGQSAAAWLISAWQVSGFAKLAAPAAALIVNSLWQGSLIMLLVWLFFKIARRANAATRHTVWFAALIALVVVPLLAGRLADPRTPVDAKPETTALAQPLQNQLARDNASLMVTRQKLQELQASRIRTQITEQNTAEVQSTKESCGVAAMHSHTGHSGQTKAGIGAFLGGLLQAPVEIADGWWIGAVFALWLSIAAFLLARLAISFCYVCGLKRRAVPLPDRYQAQLSDWLATYRVRRKVRLLSSDEISVPVAVGLFHPAIIIPESLMRLLSAEELNQVGLHELAHLLRRDDWTNLLQHTLRAIFFFHPAVHWICREITLQREISCDDWVLSVTARPRPYARCLSKLVEFASRPRRPLPVPGAFLTGNQILRRVEMMLSRKTSVNPRPSRIGLLVGLSVVLAAVLQLAMVTPVIAVPRAESAQAIAQRAPAPPEPPEAPEPPQAPEAPREAAGVRAVPSVPATPSVPAVPTVPSVPAAPAAVRSGSAYASSMGEFGDFNGSMSINHDDGATTVVYSDGSYKVRIEMDGDVKFNPDETGIESISKDGYFIIYEKDGRKRRELEVAPSRDGSVEYFYSVERKEVPYDADAKAWFADLIPELFRRTGINAEERVQRILDKDGTDGVLREISQIESDYVKRLYFQALLTNADLTGEETRDVLRQMDREMSSDYEKTELLIEMAETTKASDEARDAWVEAVRGIDSDYETRRALEAMSHRTDLDKSYAQAVLDLTDNMDSDYEIAELLIELAALSRDTDTLRNSYLRAVGRLDSDYEKRRVLTALSIPSNAPDEFISSLLELAGTIDSDYERAEYLIDLAPYATRQDGLLRSYIDAASGIGSDYETRRVLTALALQDDVSKQALLDLLDIASRIDSDYEKAEFLTQYSHLYQRDQELEDALANVIDTIDSSYERDRVYSSLYKKSRDRRRGER